VLAVAIFVALGIGTAWAASTAPRNSVATKSIRNKAVTTPKLRNNAVTTAKIRNGAVTAKKVKSNSLTGSQINESTLDFSVLQRRVSGSCGSGETMTGVNQDGTVSCVTAGGPPSGPAGGSLSGSYPDPTIALEAITDPMVAAANKDGEAGTPSMRTLGSGALQAMPGNATPGGPPTGSAGGALSGTFPNPSLAAGAVTDTMVAAANKDGAAGVPSMRTLGSGALQAMPGNATPGGPPTGVAGGVLSGSYPNPTLNVSGGPCANGQALTNLSGDGVLTCAPGILVGAGLNFAATDPQFSGSGQWNSAFGLSALKANSTGSSNTAIGFFALQGNTTGGNNSAVGDQSLRDNTTGTSNTAIGGDSLSSNTAGNSNSAVGRVALFSNTSGSSNSAVGEGALSLNKTGNENSALGRAALNANTSGSGNAAVGVNALLNNTIGSDNVAIGQGAGSSLTTGNNNIAIGSNVTGVAGEANTTRIGSGITRTFIAGISGVTTGGAAVPVQIDGSGQLGITSSSRRFKRDINPIGAESRGLMNLDPVSFRYRNGSGSLQYGLIAEEVAKVFPNLVTRGSKGKPLAIAYQQLPALLLQEIQRQHHQIADQERRISRQQARNSRIESQLMEIQAQVDSLRSAEGGR
jgi:hypothetical protein